MRYLRENKGTLLLAFLVAPAFYIDRTVMVWISGHCAFHSAEWYRPIDYLVKIGTHGTTIIVLSAVVFLGAKPYSRRLSDIGRTLFAGVITAGIAVQGVKHLFGRARPRVTFDTLFIGPSIRGSYDSFPSGHTTLLFCLAFILSRYFPRYRILFYLYAVIGAADRLLGLSHFPSDVLAGAVLGTVISKLALSGKIAGITPPCPVSE
ncbi:MAG: phosphatase PAP2 family protein [Nitrospiraceae bacterium]|nr:phosphatase PAP2 family protein [Nitrospiraceae bacterium]